jgi:hypothetical protein
MKKPPELTDQTRDSSHEVWIISHKANQNKLSSIILKQSNIE